ncbi:hypothetical protein EDE08_12639 [Bradyrhizobium sp. R2.2-H]|uniref:hypothetical protein n=1 Tax=unclassified Bradyrhizobium TaxID=2631580 RepID=UPI001046E2D5|nr:MULTISPECIES: hypothetical protein [unclassified Bradyrhizobium]TCU60276.1 hypothetical protein EDE10_12621 [Bradyrhizobium sp. Y-H1]TCU63928.1 hypothetical protein EDE08_12639 [Bradyrhizobium sp. R2.2-H]
MAVAVGYLAWQLWLTIAAPRKIVNFAGGSDKVNILVVLPFEPERFHVQLMQTYGRVSGTQEKSVEVRGVKRADLTTVARPYWVTRIEPLQPGG